MRIAAYVRSNHLEVRGGDLIQMRGTTAALRKAGVDVELVEDPSAPLDGIDVVHLFNSPWFAETLSFLDNARRQGVPVALSTIFWPKAELTAGVRRSGPIGLLRRVAGDRGAVALLDLGERGLGRVPRSAFGLERRLMASADILLPNSEGEQRQLERLYGLRGAPYRVVRNAIDPAMFERVPQGERERYVLSVGRIEPRKNTLPLIRACRNAGIPLVLVGDFEADDPYARTCLELVDGTACQHVRGMEQRDLLAYFYAAAVHAQVSWYETPGLASMEAACGGCAIVSTDRGSTREYFGDLVHYCDPWSQESIEAALRAALAGPPDPALRETILARYTWDLAARDTIEAYRQVLVR